MIVRERRKTDNYRQEIMLNCGERIVLRPICAQDKPAMQAFYGRLSEESRFLRYQYHKSEMTENDLRQCCEIDYDNNLALVAEKGVNGCKEIVGVGRFYRLDNRDCAEVALEVQDTEQGKGIGTQLLKHLALQARRADIYYFVGEVLRANGKVLSLFRKADPALQVTNSDATTCMVNLSVPEIIRNGLVLPA